MRLLWKLLARRAGLSDDDAVTMRYVAAIGDGGRRYAISVETLIHHVLVEMPTDVIRRLLAAYEIKIDPAALNVRAAARPNHLDELPGDVYEIVTGAYLMAKVERGARDVDPADVLVSLATHPASAALLDRFGLTRLKIAYFLSHGRALPVSVDDEVRDLPERSDQVFVRLKNDDYTPMDLVTKILSGVFALDDGRAQETMWMIHRDGNAFLGPYPYAEGHERVASATAIAREAGQPLLLTLVRDKALARAEWVADAKHRRLRRVSARQGRPIGFVRQYWRGEQGLASGFWITAVMGGLLWRACEKLLPTVLRALSLRKAVGPALATLAIVVAVFIWLCVGIWRAASRYKENSRRSRVGTLSQAAIIVAGIGFVGLAARSVVLSRSDDPQSSIMNVPPPVAGTGRQIGGPSEGRHELEDYVHPVLGVFKRSQFITHTLFVDLEKKGGTWIAGLGYEFSDFSIWLKGTTEPPADMVDDLVLLLNWPQSRKREVEARVFRHYQENRDRYLEHWRDQGSSEEEIAKRLPLIKEPAEVWKLIERPLYIDGGTWSEVSVAFATLYDQEHELHISFSNNEVSEVWDE